MKTNTPKLRFKEFTDEWQEKKLGGLFDHFGGTSLEDQVVVNGSHKFISIGNYTKDGKYVDNGQRINFRAKTQTKLLNKNEIAMVLNDKTASGDIIGSSIIIDEDNTYIYNQRTEKLVCKEEIFPEFAWILLNSPKHRKKVYKIAQGGTQIYVNYPSVEKLIVNIPSLSEQEKIADFLTTVDEKIGKLEEKKKYLKNTKKA
jgi:type I restriction enzyme S subunit